jgi:hypothetical protein
MSPSSSTVNHSPFPPHRRSSRVSPTASHDPPTWITISSPRELDPTEKGVLVQFRHAEDEDGFYYPWYSWAANRTITDCAAHAHYYRGAEVLKLKAVKVPDLKEYPNDKGKLHTIWENQPGAKILIEVTFKTHPAHPSVPNYLLVYPPPIPTVSRYVIAYWQGTPERILSPDGCFVC